MPIAPASDSALSRAAAHLDAAFFLALRNARSDIDELMSPWADTAHTISVASSGLAGHLPGPVDPVEHPDCRRALQAATVELAQVRADVDAPLDDLVFVMEFLVPALAHVHADYQSQPIDPAPA